MTISDVSVRMFEAGGPVQLFVDITASDGMAGTGECWWGVPALKDVTAPADASAPLRPIASAVENIFQPLLIGEAAGEIDNLRRKMMLFAYRYGIEGILSAAMSGIDLALWDLQGRRLGVPVIELLGGPVRSSLRAYASLPPLREAKLLQREVARAVDSGFQGVKLHELTAEDAGLARAAAGPEAAIMVDVNGHFNVTEAIELARRMAEHDIYWFEEPTWPMRDHRAMGQVRANGGLRIAAGENEQNLEGLNALMQSGAADVVMPEVAKIGGLTVLRQVGTLAELHNVTVSPHSFRSGPAMYANVHWALNCPQADWVETPFLPEGLDFASGTPLPAIVDGQIYLPDGPGLGLPNSGPN